MSPTQSRRAIRIAVYVMLVLSAGTAVLLGDRLWAAARGGELPLWAPLCAPCTFTAFVAVYAADRWLLVRRKGYSIGRAAVQVAFAIVFLSLLWPHQAAELRLTRQANLPEEAPALRLLRHEEASVRAAACELLGLRAQRSALDRIQELAAADRDPQVREACQQALARLDTRAEPIPPPQKPPR